MPAWWACSPSRTTAGIGRLYIGTAFAFFLGAGVLALLMRIQLAVPSNSFLGYATYNQLEGTQTRALAAYLESLK
jgi:cytochrome c oxidase subunit I+III